MNMKIEGESVKAFASVLAFSFAMAFGASAFAAPIPCSTDNASANGSTADECVGDDAIGANPVAETSFVNANFQDGGDPFVFVDKTGEDSAVDGFVLSVTPGDDTPYHFFFTLTVPDEFVGTIADFALVIKQGTDSTIAYLFNAVTLGIDGGFNNFWLNPQGQTVNDFSHASALLRVTDGPVIPPEQIPEPGILLLVGAGLMGLGLARRRRPAV